MKDTFSKAAFCAFPIWKAPFSSVTQPFKKAESWLICTTFANGTDWLVSSTTFPLMFCAFAPSTAKQMSSAVKNDFLSIIL